MGLIRTAAFILGGLALTVLFSCAWAAFIGWVSARQIHIDDLVVGPWRYEGFLKWAWLIVGTVVLAVFLVNWAPQWRQGVSSTVDLGVFLLVLLLGLLHVYAVGKLMCVTIRHMRVHCVLRRELRDGSVNERAALHDVVERMSPRTRHLHVFLMRLRGVRLKPELNDREL